MIRLFFVNGLVEFRGLELGRSRSLGVAKVCGIIANQFWLFHYQPCFLILLLSAVLV